MNNIPYLDDDSDYPPQKLKGKAILLGESSVGKTCIINRLNDNTFTAITATTLGSAFIEKTYEINNIELTLNIWDTAGQEIYRSLNRIFYRDADIIIFVYDITKRKTFEEMKNYWYRQIEMSSEISNPVIGVAANKCDLSNQAEVNEREGMEFAKKINAVFQETSASIDCGINELFGKLAKKYISSLIKRSNEKKEEMSNKVMLTSHQSDMSASQRCCG